MRTLSNGDLLDLWERGFRRHPLDQGLLVLAAALPEVSYEGLADWPIGRRNQALAQVHSRCFGPRLRGWLSCAHCQAKLEFELDAQALAAGSTARVQDTVAVGGRTFRLPTSRDLARLVNESDSAAGPACLARNCLMGPNPPIDWPAEELSAIGESLAAGDPLAETWLTLDCPACGGQSQELLDLLSFLWAEIGARAREMLMAIHTLAGAYGWSEAEILALSDHRRAMYLEMAQP